MVLQGKGQAHDGLTAVRVYSVLPSGLTQYACA